MLVARNDRLGIQRILGMGENRVGDEIGPPLIPVLLYGVADDLTRLGSTTGLVVIPQPPPVKIPGQLFPCLRIVWIRLSEG